MPADQPDIIKCYCGQRMRVPTESQSNVFKCVRCGALVERESVSATGGLSDTQRGALPSSGSDALLEIFWDAGLLNEEQRRLVRNEHQAGQEKIFETILRLELITLEQFHLFMARESGTAAINLANFTIDRNLTELIPVELAARHWVLPIDKLGRSLTVAMVCPMDTEAIAAIEHYTGLRLRPMLCNMDDFQSSLRKHYRADTEGIESLAKLPGRAAAPAAKEEPVPPAAETAVPAQEEVAPAQEAPQPAQGVVAPGAPSGPAILEAIGALVTLPIQSRVLNQVDAKIGIGVEGLRQIIGIVEKSPPFAAKIMSTANSHAFGIPGHVESIPMAAVLLGEEAVSILAVGMPKYPASTERQWLPLNRFSRNAAELASVFATACGRVVPGVAYCAALLHGIGSYALGEVAQEACRTIDPRLVGKDRQSAEEQAVGVGHTEAGVLLCRGWRLPRILCAAVQFYLEPEKAESFRDVAELVFIATRLATPEGDINKEGLKACEGAFQYLNISSGDVSRVIQERLKVDASA